MHIIGGQEKPVAYASWVLTQAASNYAQIEWEALAIVFAVKKFYQYLCGRPFTLVTNHRPLCKILGHNQGVPTLAAARVQRWALILSAYCMGRVFRWAKSWQAIRYYVEEGSLRWANSGCSFQEVIRTLYKRWWLMECWLWCCTPWTTGGWRWIYPLNLDSLTNFLTPKIFKLQSAHLGNYFLWPKVALSFPPKTSRVKLSPLGVLQPFSLFP